MTTARASAPASAPDGGPSTWGASFAVLLLDLDGVLWRGSEVLEGAVAAVVRAQQAGADVRAVTNNASRPPSAVAARLADAGLDVSAPAVVTSATAAAALLAEQHPPGARVLVCGAPALAQALQDVGLEPVAALADGPVAVVTGWSDDLTYEQQAQAALAVRAGTPWTATNMDATLPTERGLLPGAGALASVVSVAAGVPGPQEVAGKPEPRLHVTALGDDDPGKALAVGDRLGTDVVAAHRAGVRACAVLSGVATLVEVLRATGEERPDDLVVDLSALDDPPPADDPTGGRTAGPEDALVRGDARLAPDPGGPLLHWRGGDRVPHDAARVLLAAARAEVPLTGLRLGDGAEVLRTSLPGLEELLGDADVRRPGDRP